MKLKHLPGIFLLTPLMGCGHPPGGTEDTIAMFNPDSIASYPNIIIFLADDLGYGSVGAYGANPEVVKTPFIDRLAEEGRLFTEVYSPSSVCSPTRYGLLTGRYYWRTGKEYGVCCMT